MLGLEWQTTLNSAGSVVLCNVGTVADSYSIDYCNEFLI